MSCTNHPVENKKDLEKKDLEQKYLEQTFFSTPVHEYLKLIFLVIVAQHLGNITNYKPYSYIQKQSHNIPLGIFLIFCFCFINSNFKLEFSIVCTIGVIAIYYILNMATSTKTEQ
jgi:hypothetical protein